MREDNLSPSSLSLTLTLRQSVTDLPGRRAEICLSNGVVTILLASLVLDIKTVSGKTASVPLSHPV